jgi:hypothetical protein
VIGTGATRQGNHSGKRRHRAHHRRSTPRYIITYKRGGGLVWLASGLASGAQPIVPAPSRVGVWIRFRNDITTAPS